MTAIRNDIAKVGGFAREIVAKRVAIIAVVTILVHLAVAYGVLNDITSDQVLGWVVSALDAVAALVTVLSIRPSVTPVADPRNDAGVPLVPATTQADPLIAVPGDGPLDQTKLA